MSQTRTFNWWIVTAPESDYQDPSDGLPDAIKYVRGQLEIGESGFRHWQLCVCLKSKRGTSFVRNLFGGRAHVEPTRSSAARDYVWKDNTRVDGTQFEYGDLPHRRNAETDWEAIWDAAKKAEIDSVPPQIRVCHYGNLRRIASDHCTTVAMERRCLLFYGRTGTGKSRRAWDEAGVDAYSKDPRTKFWDGYRGETNVVIDEFRG